MTRKGRVGGGRQLSGAAGTWEERECERVHAQEHRPNLQQDPPEASSLHGNQEASSQETSVGIVTLPTPSRS